jgi:hypothetical protein
MIANELNAALANAKVAKPYMAAAKALHSGKVRVEEDDNGDFSVVADSDMGPQPVEKYIMDWAQTEEGQAFVAPPNNGGGGAPGGSGSGRGSKSNPWKKETRNLTEQGRIKRENPELAERLKREAGAG